MEAVSSATRTASRSWSAPERPPEWTCRRIETDAPREAEELVRVLEDLRSEHQVEEGDILPSRIRAALGVVCPYLACAGTPPPR